MGFFEILLCFQAQQAAEKAIKAVYISKKVAFPYIHDISHLLAALEKENVIIPNDIKTASTLTLYAAQTRYPGLEGPVSDEKYRDSPYLVINPATRDGVVIYDAEKITTG